MKRKWLITGISTIAVILLTLTSFTNVIGYQTVQSSNQQTIKERINQRELLFQTIVDIANNKEIQRIILKSQMMSGKFFNSDAKFPTTITKQQLKQMYFIGLILSKVISKSKIQTMVQQYKLQNPITYEGIQVVFEKDAPLNKEISHLKNSECDCEDKTGITAWTFPFICVILAVLMVGFLIFSLKLHFLIILYEILINIFISLNCGANWI